MPYLVFILISLAAGGLSAIAVMRGLPAYERLAKPPLTPPSAAFPVVWGILYILMGAGAARVWLTRGRGRGAALALYGLQLAISCGACGSSLWGCASSPLCGCSPWPPPSGL